MFPQQSSRWPGGLSKELAFLLVFAAGFGTGGRAFGAWEYCLLQPRAPNPESRAPNPESRPWQDRAEFLRDGLEQAESFRRRLLKRDSSGVGRGELIAEAIERFPDRCRDPLSGRPNLEGFHVAATDFLKQIRGEVPFDGAKAFERFTGRWYGLWDRMRVDHDWHPTRSWNPPLHIAPMLNSCTRKKIVPGLPRVTATQYAWVGDGFCWSYVAIGSEKGGPSGSVVLGMVYHVDSSDPQKIRRRRPHVGYYAGDGKLIWVTAGEIFFEQVLPGKADGMESYAITGFFYKIENGRLSNRGDAFQAVYTRSSDRRPPWFRFPLDLDVPEP